jgi:hypothetical protein
MRCKRWYLWTVHEDWLFQTSMFRSVFTGTYDKADSSEGEHAFIPFAERRTWTDWYGTLQAFANLLFDMFQRGDVQGFCRDPGFLLNLMCNRRSMMKHMDSTAFRILMVRLVNRMRECDAQAFEFAKGATYFDSMKNLRADDQRATLSFKRCNVILFISGIVNRLVPKYHTAFIYLLFRGKYSDPEDCCDPCTANFLPDNCGTAKTYVDHALIMMQTFKSAFLISDLRELVGMHESILVMQLNMVDPAHVVKFDYEGTNMILGSMHGLVDFLKSEGSEAVAMAVERRKPGEFKPDEECDTVHLMQWRIIHMLDGLVKVLLPDFYLDFCINLYGSY